jgi:serine/threonine protein kinase/WD40 repeat protein
MSNRVLDERSIFLRAVELTGTFDRSSFLDLACENDWQLRRQVEALLSAHEESCGLLDAPDHTLPMIDRRPTTECPGAVLGPYTLLREIGDGGMGHVWMAEQTYPVRRTVALKIIKPGMDTRHVIARFGAERQALAMMDHPNIAKVFDAGTTHCGRPYFVMELVDGVPITEYCDDHNLTLRQRLQLFLPICHAVQHAHQKGIIHRDLKPSNVLVALYDGEPVPKVIDFGVAKATSHNLIERTTITQSGVLIGTLEYMSPEQASFNTLEVDTRSDIYSLGVLLYELLTGWTPFDKKHLRELAFDDSLRMIRDLEPPRPSARLSELIKFASTASTSGPVRLRRAARRAELEPSVASIAAYRKTDASQLARLIKGDLDWIVMRALERDRDRRYQTANELAMDLQRFLADLPVAASPPTVRYRLRKFVRRNKGPVLAASSVVLALVAGIIGTTWGMLRATDARSIAVSAANQKQAALAAALTSQRDATEQLFLALLNRARAGRYSRQIGQRLESLEALLRAARIRFDERLRDEAIAAMALPDLRLVSSRHSWPPGTAAVACGSRNQLYARADTQGVISIRTISNDREIQRIKTVPIQGYLYFSPDDRFLIGLADGFRLLVWRVADGKPALRDEPRECRTHAFSPDGQRLAVAQHERVLCFDLATGQEVRRWRLHAIANSLAFHTDNRRLAVGYRHFGVTSIYESVSGALLTELPVGEMINQVVAWHPAGDRLAVAGSNPRIQIWDVAAKRKAATLAGHVQNVTELTFHSDGELLASHGWDGIVILWNPSSGRQLLSLPSAGEPQFSPDGRHLAITRPDDRADLFEVTPVREYRTLVNSGHAGWDGCFFSGISPDGRLLAVGMNEGSRVWDLRSRRELVALPAWTSSVFFESTAQADGDPTTPNQPGFRMLTSGSGGLVRWPVESGDPRGRLLRLGPPRQLSRLPRATFVSRSEGRALGAATELGGANQILDLETGRVQRELGRHPAGDVQALSADGRWAASCGWHSDRVRLWNARTGELVHEWVLGKRTHVFFTPDSQVLVLSRDDEFSFWSLDTLQPIYRLRRDLAQLPGWVAFSPDGRLMALEMAPAVISLKEVATGRTVAKLEDPHGDRATSQGFTPDGTQLVVVASYAGAIHIWDLRSIRTRLKAMGLDWNWPEFPPTSTADTAGETATIEVVPGDSGFLKQMAAQRARQAIERFRRELDQSPNSAYACNILAWSLLTGPDALRDVKTALPLAEKAVRLAAGNANFRNTQGLAYYRAGRYRDAVDVLQPNLERPWEITLPYDLYFLAMSYQRLGATARARNCYDSAIRWAELQRASDGAPSSEREELFAFRVEAEQVLGITREKN